MKIFLRITFAIILLQTSNLTIFAQTASISCPGNKVVSTEGGTCAAIVNNIDPVFSPAGARVGYSVTRLGLTDFYSGSASGKSFQLGINTVTYSLLDYPGVTCTFTIVVEDHTPPTITCPANITVLCYDDVPSPATAYATDDCTPSNLIDIKYMGEVKSNEVCQNRYLVTRTFKATDAAGNSSTCQQIITVYDNDPPYFIQPPPTSPLNVACSSNVPLGNASYFTALDDCNPNGDEEVAVEYKEVKTDGSCPNKYTLTRTWTATDFCGNKTTYTQIINVDDKVAPEFDQNPISSINVACASEIPAPMTLTATDNCYGGTATVTFSEVKSEEECVNRFNLTRTWTATDACGNTATKKQVIVVYDGLAPVFDGYAPTDLNVSCAKDIPAPVTQTAKDNCGTLIITLSEVKSNIQCANRFTLTRTWTATDSCGNKATRRQTITVNDTEGPKITSISADPVVLWPPNHKMRDVTINYTATDNCEVTSSLSVTSSDPVSGGSDGDQSPDWEVIDAHHVRLRAEKANNGQARIYTIKVTITDGCNAPFDTSINVVVAHNITDPITGNPYKIGSTVGLSGMFWDGPGKVHTAKWLLDGTVATNGTVTEPSGMRNGKVNGSYKFNTAGVFKLQMNVTDQNGITSYANTNNDLDAIVVVYDPNGGYAYGGGWFNSQPGSLPTDATAQGKASYGFYVNYRTAAKPKGETQFEFKVGSFEFNALNFDYLAINGAKAQFRGTGKIIGGQSGIGFIMTVIDGEADGSGLDKIRMKIFNRNTGQVYYDNLTGSDDAADPQTVVGTNSSIVIQGTQAPVTSLSTTVAENKENIVPNTNPHTSIIAHPNPSNKYFIIELKTADIKSKIQLQVFDQMGRVVETRNQLMPGQFIKLGEKYRAGVYYVRMRQGNEEKELKLIKL